MFEIQNMRHFVCVYLWLENMIPWVWCTGCTLEILANLDTSGAQAGLGSRTVVNPIRGKL